MVCIDRVTFTVPVAPGLGAINRKLLGVRQVGRRRRLPNSREYNAFKGAVALAARMAARKRGALATGELAVAITEYWPTRRGDVDAPIKATLDGLQAGGLIDNDARIVELHARKRVDRVCPRVAIAVWPVSL